MKGFIGSANIDTNSHLCMSSVVAGKIKALSNIATNPAVSMPNADGIK